MKIDYVVLSSDDNNLYKDFYPIVSKKWNNFGYKVLFLNITDNNSDLSSYFTPLPSKILIPLHAYVIARRGDCKNRVVNIAQIVPHSDLMLYLNSTHHRPSFNYQETFAVISDNKLFIYTENKTEGNFEITDLHFSYLRYPTPIELIGMPKIDGSISSTTINCELPEHLEDEILDVATRQIAMNTDNQNAVQYAQINRQDNE